MIKSYKEIIDSIIAIDPIKYGQTRNYIDGAVTQLLPYISRGVISTKFIFESLFYKGYKVKELDSLLKQLTWRDYFQRVWIHLKEDINKDIKSIQLEVVNFEMPQIIYEAQTKITAIDTSINDLLTNGYMHNHSRLYVASLCCNVAKCHWLKPAKWMYYHLLDADWASNALSWQWVAGTNSQKKYFANQDNVNKFTKSVQHSTFIDLSYENLIQSDVPNQLRQYSMPELNCMLPKSDSIVIDEGLPIYIYNFYNLDPNWSNTIHANRILLLEPHFFKQYPVSSKTLDFILNLASDIKDIQIFVGSFNELFLNYKSSDFHFKEHPTNSHY